MAEVKKKKSIISVVHIARYTFCGHPYKLGGSNHTCTGIIFASKWGTGRHLYSVLSSQASVLSPHLRSIMGTKLAEECSNRGFCNRITGHCMCYSKFFSSDGKGGSGDLGDCGYYDPTDPPIDCSTAMPLWGFTEDVCSGELLLRSNDVQQRGLHENMQSASAVCASSDSIVRQRN